MIIILLIYIEKDELFSHTKCLERDMGQCNFFVIDSDSMSLTLSHVLLN